MYLKKSSFSPLILNKDSIAVKDGETIKTPPPLKPAILRPPTPKTALQEPHVPVPEIAGTNNNDMVRKIYPSLPVEEMTHMFKVNETVVHFLPPPPTFLPKWEYRFNANLPKMDRKKQNFGVMFDLIL